MEDGRYNGLFRLGGRDWYRVKNEHRKFEYFSLFAICYAQIGKLRVHILQGWKNCGFVSVHADPGKSFGILNIRKSFRQTSGEIFLKGFLPIKLHYPLFAQSDIQILRSKIFRLATITHDYTQISCIKRRRQDINIRYTIILKSNNWPN